MMEPENHPYIHRGTAQDARERMASHRQKKIDVALVKRLAKERIAELKREKYGAEGNSTGDTR